MIRKIKKYLGEINSIHNCTQESHESLIHIGEIVQKSYEKAIYAAEASQKLIEKMACLENIGKSNESGTNVPISSVKTVEDILYIGCPEDKTLFGYMRSSLLTWSANMIDLFFDLTEKYYGKLNRKTDGYFLDIGANIGTTSIYVKKRINQNLKVIAFEPIELNYKLLRCNCILNGFDDIRCENFGLSNTEARKVFLYHKENSGGAGVIYGRNLDKKLNVNESICLTKTLDAYLKNLSISANTLDYIWLDVEGHEVEVLEGGLETLMKSRIPLLQEFNAKHYIALDSLNRYADVVKKVYSSFIDCRNVRVVHPIEEIRDFGMKLVEQEKLPATDLFFC